MKEILNDISGLFFPRSCAVCGELLVKGAEFVCTQCRWDIPLTGYWREVDNPVTQALYGQLPVVNASAFFFFVHDSKFQQFVHSFKYRGGWRYAVEMGEWFGHTLKESPLYADIDVLVPIPLHFRKRLKRGYNQAEYIAKGMAKAMGVELDIKSVYRKMHNPSQTSKSRNERWDNVQNIFALRHPEQLDGKHILLVDDVLTTGSTIVSCGDAILKAAPRCKLSVGTLALSSSLVRHAQIFDQE